MGQDQSSVPPPRKLSERSLAGVAEYILSGQAQKIVVMIGAGLSTAAGIPDFRSPKTGLYANLQRFNLEDPTDIFDIQFFQEDPKPFYTLAEEIYPGKYKPTISHQFISLLAKKGLLHQLFTQNVDCLERLAGVPDDLLVEAHGSFNSQRCIKCKTEYPTEEFRERVRKGEVVYCPAEECKGALIKPDITFFGEQLPTRFRQRRHLASEADLIIVMGTSLQVGPFNELPEDVPHATPRLLINRDRVGSFGLRSDDVIWLGDCDESVRELAEALGWTEELEKDWTELVGAEEAEIQKTGARMCVEDDVSRLAEKIDHVHIVDDDGFDANGPSRPFGGEQGSSGQGSEVDGQPRAANQDGPLESKSDDAADQLVDATRPLSVEDNKEATAVGAETTTSPPKPETTTPLSDASSLRLSKPSTSPSVPGLIVGGVFIPTPGKPRSQGNT
ncbi:NAD-dependent histone deacetylase SIR2 [Rhypophila sp. PSN 637]